MRAPPNPAFAAPGRRGILIVDDDPDDLLALEATLSPLREEIVRARDGVEVLGLLLQRSFAVVIMDLLMPRLNGFETGTLIRQRECSRDLPIILLTGFDVDGLGVLPGYSPDFELMSKPVSPEVLRARVLACLARRADAD
ncbi:MAG: response regulator [Elusimicrobia bacterium]|nr:response regulator [Elusimicrobiota bacterium]